MKTHICILKLVIISSTFKSIINRNVFDAYRVFPTRRRSEVETLLQKYRGDVVMAMESMLSGGNYYTRPCSYKK